jgi:POT family proton-dependent oligopeptide transporter
MPQRGFFGHPRGLATLFFTEMWERFSYYGMRAFLILFMTAPIALGGMGFAEAKGGVILGTYAACVYLLSLPGGWIADRFTGARRATLWGGILIMLGHLSLAMPAAITFYVGLALVALGTGLLKPNISAIVGRLYAPDDVRRDAGFSIFYIGINVGALLAPIACGLLVNTHVPRLQELMGGLIHHGTLTWNKVLSTDQLYSLAHLLNPVHLGWLVDAPTPGFRSFLLEHGINPNSCWHFGFALAAVGMAFGLVQYWRGAKYLGDAGVHPVPPKDDAEKKRNRMILAGILVIAIPLIGVAVAFDLFGLLMAATPGVLFVSLFMLGQWTKQERRQLVLIIILFCAAVVFWACFEQAAGTLTLFAQQKTRLTLFGIGFPASWFQALNSIFVIILAPLFAWLWVWLRDRNPSSPVKFGVGMFLVGLGFLIMYPAAKVVMGGDKASPGWLTTLYFIHTCGELCLSPVGLSSMTRLAPQRIAGMVMGIWFLASSVGNFLAGKAVGLTQTMPLDHFFIAMFVFPAVLGVILFLAAGPIKRMMGTETPAAH